MGYKILAIGLPVVVAVPQTVGRAIIIICENLVLKFIINLILYLRRTL